MCGIAGWWHSETAEEMLRSVASSMGEVLQHRGPDDAGLFVDAPAGLALAHRRLAVLDLSPEGHQPMVSPCGGYVLVYNGEIYNFRALRAELEAGGTSFQSQSDTEVLLKAMMAWGVARTVERAEGMFAFALWERQARTLWLGRDRFGIKPLYYGWHKGGFAFASELKALRCLPGWSGNIDPQALTRYFEWGYVPAPFCIYEGLHKLPPGHLLCLTPDTLQTKAATPAAYWSWKPVAVPERFEDAVDELDCLLSDAVAARMVSDVPLGAFLSGGVDSSLLVALMQKAAADPVRTFTIGFAENRFDESPYAEAVAAHLGTRHTTCPVSKKDALALVPELPEIYDEPFADSSQIPTALLSRLTRKEVTVALSGDGADELFAGYPRHVHAPSLWRRAQAWPNCLRRGGAWLLRTVPLGAWDSAISLLRPVCGTYFRHRKAGDIVPRMAELMLAPSLADVYGAVRGFWRQGLPVREPCGAGWVLPAPGGEGDVRTMMHWDGVQYLPDDCLVKVDRASMSAGLEVRVPMLDGAVAAWSRGLPERYLLDGDGGKRVLRHLLYRYVPRALVDRPKKGFAIPLAAWLRHDLSPWAADLLQSEAYRAYVDAEPVQACWQAHCSGRIDCKDELWSVLMFQSWLAKQK